MKVSTTRLPGVLIVEPPIFADTRGAFFESWHKRRYEDAGIPGDFVQDNFSISSHRVLRGLHFQQPHGQAKLITAVRGEVYDVAVDVRAGSPSFGQWIGVLLSDVNRRQLFIPAGFAHGFQALSAEVLMHYKCSRFYAAHAEHSLLWSDHDLAIDWPLEPILSEKDARGVRLRDLTPDQLPVFGDS